MSETQLPSSSRSLFASQLWAMAATTPSRTEPVCHAVSRSSALPQRITTATAEAFLVLQGAEPQRFWEVASEAVFDSVKEAPLVIVPMACKHIHLDRYAFHFGRW